MINSGKVIRHISAEISIARMCKKDFASVDIDMLSDAYELLKEQEPVTPTWRQGKAYCGKCGQRLPQRKADREINYCGYCGQEVKWE